MVYFLLYLQLIDDEVGFDICGDTPICKKEAAIENRKQKLAGSHPNADQKRYFVSLAKKNSRPGIFEMLGEYDLKTDDAELFGDDHYRRLINLLIYRTQS